MNLARQMSPQGVPGVGEPGLLQISRANPGMPVFYCVMRSTGSMKTRPVLKGPGSSLSQPHLNVPLSTSWPLSRTWMPSFSSEPKAMYSANAQSTVRFLVMSARPRRIRERPVRMRSTVQPQAWRAEAPEPWGEYSVRKQKLWVVPQTLLPSL